MSLRGIFGSPSKAIETDLDTIIYVQGPLLRHGATLSAVKLIKSENKEWELTCITWVSLVGLYNESIVSNHDDLTSAIAALENYANQEIYPKNLTEKFRNIRSGAKIFQPDRFPEDLPNVKRALKREARQDVLLSATCDMTVS